MSVKKIFLLTFFTLILACNVDDDDLINNVPAFEWTFIACEGNYGSSNGSITMINGKGDIKELNDIGDVVNSLAVYKNKLIVLVNNSHKILIYEIYEDGLRLPGIEIDTQGSSPREMVVVDDKLYFTNWNSSDVKIFDMINYIIEDSIQLSGYPESIVYGDESLWVGIQLNDDYSDSNKLHKIDPISKTINQTYEIGYGPTDIEINGESIYVANTYYDSSYNAYYLSLIHI